MNEELQLWREISLGIPADALTIQPLIEIRDAYRAEGIVAASHEANRQGDGLWTAICRAGIDAVASIDHSDRDEWERAMKSAERCKSDTIRARITNAASERYWRQSVTTLDRAWELQ